MTISFTRLILFTQDVEKLKTFYHQHFGFSVTEHIENEWAVLKSGDFEIAFHKIGTQYSTQSSNPFKVDSNAKMVFEITDNLADFRETLLVNNVKMRDLKTFRNPDFQACDGEDPEGNVFQIVRKTVSLK